MIFSRFATIVLLSVACVAQAGTYQDESRGSTEGTVTGVSMAAEGIRLAITPATFKSHTDLTSVVVSSAALKELNLEPLQFAQMARHPDVKIKCTFAPVTTHCAKLKIEF